MTIVIAQHCSILPFGWMGVWLFYVISGYVITRGFAEGAYAGTSFASRYGNFISRRLLRIAPIYFAYVALNAILLIAVSGASRLGDLPYLITFTYNWQVIFDPWPGRSGWAPFGHLWTLSVEQQFYLFFPFLALLVPPRRQVPALMALIAVGPLLRWAWLATIGSGFSWGSTLVSQGLFFGGLEYGVYASSISHIDSFLTGALIARFSPTLTQRRLASNMLWVLALGATIAYVIFYVGVNYENGARGYDLLRNVISNNPHGQYREVFVYCAVNLLAAAVLLHVLLERRGSHALASRPAAWIGRVSYGGYLLHVAVLLAVGSPLIDAFPDLNIWIRRIAAFAIVWCITIALASISFRYFESPIARHWRRRRVSSGPLG